MEVYHKILILDEFEILESTKEYIILKNGVITYARSLIDKPWLKHLDINELRDHISLISSQSWRNDLIKSKNLKRYRYVLSMMVHHSRNYLIDELLGENCELY